MRTPLCDLLGVDVPILNVGFGAAAGPELAAAVSNAGGLGVLGLSALPPEEVRERIARTRAETSRPFGGNVIISGLRHEEVAPLVEERIEICLEERLPVLVLFWGDASRFVDAARTVGTKLLLQVGSLDEARVAAEAGVDAVIAQGREAGGHVKSETSIWELLPACVEAVAPLPVLASGGIGTGAEIARALDHGAQGVSLGTAFLAAEEADIHPEYQRRVLAGRAEDAVYTPALFDVGWKDAPHRALRAKTHEEWEAAGCPPSGERPGEGETIGVLRDPWRTTEIVRYSSFMTTSAFDGTVDYAPLWAGESVEHVTRVEPAAEIVRRLWREATAAAGTAATQ